MRYIVIDDFNGSVNLACNLEGEVIIFENKEDAQEEANDCQNGFVVPLGTPVFSQDEMLYILVSADQALNPETYKETTNMESEEFMDAIDCLADELDLNQEFEQARKEGGYIGEAS